MRLKREILFLLVSLVLAQSLLGCDFIYGIIQKEAAQEKVLVGEIVPFMHNENVERIQQLLKINGYSCGKIDGKMGPKFREAILRFQEDRGLNPNRYVDNETWQELNFFSDLGLVADGEINTSFVQGILVQAGFNPGKIDGKLGPKTVLAIRQFQEANGLKPDGKIGPNTLFVLSDYIEVEAY